MPPRSSVACRDPASRSVGVRSSRIVGAVAAGGEEHLADGCGALELHQVGGLDRRRHPVRVLRLSTRRPWYRHRAEARC